MFDDEQMAAAKHSYEYSFSEHTLRVTDIVTGYGGCISIFISASEDQTCKVWSLSKGKLLRNIVFPSVIDAIAMDPGEHIFYAASRDGKIYIASLNSQCCSTGNYGMYIIGCYLFDIFFDGYQLVAGSEDDMVLCTMFFLLESHQAYIRTSMNSQDSSARRHGSLLPPPLEKYMNSGDELSEGKAFVISQDNSDLPLDFSDVTVATMDKQIDELQQKGSSGAAEVEIQRLRVESQKCMEMIQQWKKMYGN